MLLYNNGTDVVVAFNRVVGNVVGNLTGTASNATVLQTARTIAISGNVTGTATSFDGSANISIDVTAINAAGITSGTLGVARGGTAASTLTAENVIIGNGTSAVKFVAPGTSGHVLTSNGSVWASTAPAAPSAPTTEQVLTATAGASAGGVGTYTMASPATEPTPTVNLGTTIAASSLATTDQTTGGYTANTTGLSGTWRFIGSGARRDASNNLARSGRSDASLFLRIS
jgi:hypothetical protein